MSSNLVESTGEDSTQKRSPSSIRNYLVPSPASSPTIKSKPLTSPNDNIIIKKDDKIKQTKTVETTVSSKVTTTTATTTSTNTKVQSTLLNMLGRTKKSVLTTTLNQPSLKRSYSAITALDNVNKSWMSQPSTKKKLEDNTEAYDRLAPSISDMVSAQAIMALPQTDYHGDSYNEQVAKACGIEPSKRILSFTAKAPTSKKVDIRKNAPQLNTTTTTATLHTPKRRILSSPEKILDAPYMADDYYLNVLDWSKHNVVAVGLGKSVYLWNADNGTIQTLKYNDDDAVASVSWSGDAKFLAIGTTKGDTQIWDTQSNTKLRSMTGQNCRIGVLSWDKHLVSSGAYDGSIVHHDVRIPKHEVMKLKGHDEEVCGLKWRWDGQALASGGNDNTVNIWDARSNQPKFTRRLHTSAVKALAWCPWSRNLLATGGGRDDKKIHFWNTTTGTRVNTINAGSQVTSLHWSKHYKEITSTHGSPHNHVTVWEYPTCSKVIDIPAHESRILHSALSPDGQVLATAAADENLKFWRIFESDGIAPLSSQITQSTEKKMIQLRRSNSIR